jgi:hypothetical protein
MTGKLSFKTMGIIIALFLALFCTQAYAQDDVEDRPEQRNSLFGGSWSMQFKFMHDFMLTDFEGALISAKRHFTDKSALRFGLDLGFSKSWTDPDTNTFAVGIAIQYIYYSSPNAPVNFYFGFGPMLEYDRFKTETEYYESYKYEREWSLGILGTWGVEWFATKNISFICEYGAGLERLSFYQERSADGGAHITTYDKSEVKLYSNSVDFGISVYF